MTADRDTKHMQLIGQIAGGHVPDDAAEFLTADLRHTVAEMAASLLKTQILNTRVNRHHALMHLWTAELTAICLVMISHHQTKGHTK